MWNTSQATAAILVVVQSSVWYSIIFLRMTQLAAACTLLVAGGQREFEADLLAGTHSKAFVSQLIYRYLEKLANGQLVKLLSSSAGFHTQRVARMHLSRMWPTAVALSLFFLCCCESAVLQSDLEALQALYAATNGAGWTNKWTNITTTDPCTTYWYGVYCDSSNTRVTE
jgi:hypothetical protein